MRPKHPGFRIQFIIAVAGILIFLTKLGAWLITNSNTIFTDALESTANIVAGLFGLYSLRVAAKPQDDDHPYGHGKIEFIAASFEGMLIAVAGLAIIIKSTYNIFNPQEIRQLDTGIILAAITGVVNYALGYYAQNAGNRLRSETLKASSAHLKSDAYSTLALVAGLVLVMVTGNVMIDSILAIVFGSYILYMAWNIMRRSLAGIMDEADFDLLGHLISALDKRRKAEWIDIHKLRLIKYGSKLHMDCHVTVPWYYDVNKAHDEIEEINSIVDEMYGDKAELFIHTDPCVPASCKFCFKDDCPVRQHEFIKRKEWTIQNVLENRKHGLQSDE